MRVLAIIPARGGSKGVPRKNVLPLDGKPMISYTIEAAQAVNALTELIVSTDDSEVQVIAKGYGCRTLVRPPHLATDTATTVDVVIDALALLTANFNQEYDAVMLLQPTSPLRTSVDILTALDTFTAEDTDSVISVTKVESYHPFYMYRVENGIPHPIMPEARLVGRRQDFPEFYLRNGAIYIANRNVLLQQRSFFGQQLRAYIMPAERSVNIDTWLDFSVAESLLRRGRSS